MFSIFFSSTFLCSYIFSLALADLLVILICVPLASVVYTFESWPWGAALCRITEFAKDISIGVSVFTLTALSAERYCAIVNPLRKLQVCKIIYSFSLFYPIRDKVWHQQIAKRTSCRFKEEQREKKKKRYAMKCKVKSGMKRQPRDIYSEETFFLLRKEWKKILWKNVWIKGRWKAVYSRPHTHF